MVCNTRISSSGKYREMKFFIWRNTPKVRETCVYQKTQSLLLNLVTDLI